jgi:hypothetical protein
MKMSEIFTDTFKALRHQLGHDRTRDTRPMWQRRLSTASEFCRALVACGYLTEEQMQRAAQRYRLGASRDGGVIFWQIDEHEVVRDGKIMHYREDCHRDHDRKPSWVSYHLRCSGQLPEDWKAEHCLFGLHLISPPESGGVRGGLKEGIAWGISEGKEKGCAVPLLQTTPPAGTPPNSGGEGAIAVVESEKTAVIMSEVRPECIWLATGGKTELNVARLKPLQGRRVILFPDTDTDGSTYREWYDVAQAAGDVYGQPFTVSAILEQHATPSQKQRKIDIADYFFEK